MDSLQRFRHLNCKRIEATTKLNRKFVFQGNNSTVINAATDETWRVAAAVVNQQEKDKAYIYTELFNPLPLGSVWKIKDKLQLLVYDEIQMIQRVDWHKYLAFVCNLEVNGYYGYFKGPEERAIKLALKETAVLQSQQAPILVIGGDPFEIGTKLLIKNRAFVINEKDNISNDGITYYTLALTTMSKDKIEEAIEIPQEEIPQIVSTPQYDEETDTYLISAGIEISLNTNNGYFYSADNVTLKVLTKDNAIFEIPFGVETATVVVKVDNVEQTYHYKVV